MKPYLRIAAVARRVVQLCFVTFALFASAATAQSILVTPPRSDLGEVPIGQQSAVRTVTLTNPGGVSVTINSLHVSSPPFQVQTGATAGTCQTSTPFTLAARTSCTINLVFVPTFGGQQSASLCVSIDGSFPCTNLEGRTPGVALSPTEMKFPPTPIGTISPPQTLTLAHEGTTGPVIIDALSFSDPGAFARAPGGTCAPNLPISLNVGESCTLNVVFQPSTANSYFGGVSTSPYFASAILRGNGITGPPLSVTPTSVNVGFQQAFDYAPPLRLRVTNPGATPARIFGISQVGSLSQPLGAFIAANSCGSNSIDANATCDLDLRVNVGEPRDISTVLAVETSAGNLEGNSYPNWTRFSLERVCADA